ncbi:MFS transporter [Actinosynnema pretiosum]|uniref:MFS transporter n=1 Tax=Actinosynnema pretiosum TaxID=42197 RepID=UPI001E5DA6CC|nr:MFS transporter [Actinosynnema pretiosum]
MSYRWVVLLVGALAQGTNAAVFLGLPSISPYLREHFGLSLPQVGLLLGAANLGTVLALVPWGAVADRRGERLVMAVGGFGAAACLALVARSGAVLAGVALFGAGLFGASVNAASGRAVLTWFPRERRGLAMGVRQTAVPLGAAVTAGLLPAVAVGSGVPVAFLALAGATALVAVAVAVWVREPPGVVRVARGGQGLVLADRRLLRLSLASGLLVVPQFTAGALLVELLHGHLGIAAATAAALFAVAQVLGGAGRLAAGIWSDRAGGRLGPLRSIGAAVAVGFAGCAALLDSAPRWLVCAALLPTAALAMSWNGLAVTAAGELAPPGRGGTALGMQNSANYLTATVTPALAGWVAVALGWTWALVLAGVCAAAARVVLARGKLTEGPVAGSAG